MMNILPKAVIPDLLDANLISLGTRHQSIRHAHHHKADATANLPCLILPKPTPTSKQPLSTPPKMSMFRAKKLDLGCFVNIKVIRDHTKRKVFEQHEQER